jgi:hypothetical protein
MGGYKLNLDDIDFEENSTVFYGVTSLPLDNIEIDTDIQLRVRMDEERVNSYADIMRDAADYENSNFPPVVVYYIEDEGTYLLSDGFHRLYAARLAGLESIKADVKEGTKVDALLFACKANTMHGIPLSNADKRRVVVTILSNPEWRKWSDRQIARVLNRVVSHQTVANIRAELYSTEERDSVKYYRNGKELAMSTERTASELATKIEKEAEVEEFEQLVESAYGSDWSDEELEVEEEEPEVMATPTATLDTSSADNFLGNLRKLAEQNPDNLDASQIFALKTAVGVLIHYVPSDILDKVFKKANGNGQSLWQKWSLGEKPHPTVHELNNAWEWLAELSNGQVVYIAFSIVNEAWKADNDQDALAWLEQNK